MELDHYEPLQPAALLRPQQPEACKGTPVQPEAPRAAHDDNNPQESFANIWASLPHAQPPTEPVQTGAAAAKPSAPEQPGAPSLKLQAAGRSVAASEGHQLPPGFNCRVHCSQPKRVRGRDGVRQFEFYFAAMCPRHGDSADLRSYADIRHFLDKHRPCV